MLENRKVLLVYPVIRGRRLQALPDLGQAFLATALRRAGYEVTFVDCVCRRWRVEDFEAYVRGESFGIVGFKMYSVDLASVQRMIRAVREAHPRTCIVAGGPHPSSSPDDIFDMFPELDYAFRGEAEISLPMLLNMLDKNDFGANALSNVPGLLYRREGQVCANAPQPVENLDALGMPAWDLIDPRSYSHIVGLWPVTKHRIVAPLHMTRGCPYTCRFCASRAVSGHVLRFRSVETVIAELKMLSEDYGVREFLIVDDMITGDRDYMMRFCAALKRARLNLAWACPMGLRLDTLDAELLHAMEDAGCYATALGIESASQRLLDFMGKGTIVEELRKTVDLVRNETNWFLVGFFIIGLPTETREEIERTIEFATSLPLDAAQFLSFMPLRGTPLHAYVVEEMKSRVGGEAPSAESGDMYVRHYAPEGMTREEISKLLGRAHRRFFLAKPSRILRMLRLVGGFYQIPRLLKVVWVRAFA